MEEDERPDGTDVTVHDLTELDQTFDQLPRAGTPAADDVPGAGERRDVRGTARLDGVALDAPWVGAVVERDGLSTPCQHSLTSVEGGRFEVTVLADEEATGCGRPGSEVVLWTYANDQKLYSTEALAWPSRHAVTFDANFSTSTPLGAARPTTEFSGEVYERDGSHLPPGARIEARVGATRCGVASVRRTGSFGGYILSVAGPGAAPACRAGGRVTFRIDGRAAVETAVNDEEHAGQLDLTVR